MILIQTKKHSVLEVAMLFLPLLLRLASTPTANLSFLLLAAFAITGRAQAIQALAMSWLFTMISPGIAPDAPLGSVGRYAVILGAFLGVFARSGILSGQLNASKTVIFTFGLGIFFIIHSLFISSIPDVSILKSVSWLIVTTTLFSAWSGLTYEEREKLFKQLYLSLVAIMIISLPLFVLPLGYLRNGSGFQGILNHPQALGSTMAILGAIAASKLFAERKPSWQYLGVLGVSMLYIMASEVRTAGLALVIGLCLAIAYVPMLPGRRMLPTLSDAFLVFAWIFWILRRSATSGVISVALIGTIMLINMGESIFFSPGGLGMLTLIMFSWQASNQRAV